MKVTCKNCNKRFEYDVYMGLCPRCSTYYREHEPGNTEKAVSGGQTARDKVQERIQTARNSEKIRPSKHSAAYYVVTFLLVFAVFAGVSIPLFFSYLVNLSGREEMELAGKWTAEKVSVGEPFSYSTGQGDYQVIVTGAKVDRSKDLAVPRNYQYIAVSYEILPPEEVQKPEGWPDNPSYYGIHMKPYLLTKSGQYLEPLYTFQIADRMGWDDDEQMELGLSDDFCYERGLLYFLVRKGDLKGLWVNSFDYDEKAYTETTLRESFEITRLRTI